MAVSASDSPESTAEVPSWKGWLPWAVGGTSLVLMFLSVILLWVDRNQHFPPQASTWSVSQITELIANAGVPILGILIALKRPSNWIGWLFLTAGAALAIQISGNVYASHALYVAESWPLGDAVAWFTNTVWPVAIAMLVLLLALFPTGRPLTPRWRVFVYAVFVMLGLMIGFSGLVSAATFRDPFGSSDVTPPGFAGVVAQIGFPIITLLIPALLVTALVGAILRFRRSRGEERLQMKWFTLAAAFVVVTFAININGSGGLVQIASNLAILALWIAIGIAMLKYRLFEIDVVIRKTLVGGVLVVFITGVYVVVVAGVGALGSQYSFLHSGPLIAAATAIIAIAFQPVLRRTRHLANRLVYGDRATPYEVLSEFSERMGDTVATSDIPQRMATILGEGTGATAAVVWLFVGGELRPTAAWPAEAPLPAPVRTGSDEDIGVLDGGRTFPVRHQNELLGALSVQMPPQEPLVGEQEKLCIDLASQAGLVLRNVLLIEELRGSRQRLVAAQDEERRKIERNIHDGAQQQLVALAIKIRLAKQLAPKDAAKAESILDEVAAEATDALENLRDLARGIYPPLLADKGLAAALDSQAKKSVFPVTVTADGIGRYAKEAEATVYFCVLEGLQNVSKYAEASTAGVTLSQANGTLSFEVVDDGKGFDTGATGYGTGLQGIADRLSAMDGTLAVRSQPGEGTTITGALPVRELPATSS